MKKTMALLLAIVMMTAMAIPASAEAQTITTSVPGVFGDTIVVETVADENGIYSVTVVENKETPGIGSVAIKQIPGMIIEAQSTEVDALSGATETSNAIKAAVAAALEEAGIDPAGFAACRAWGYSSSSSISS